MSKRAAIPILRTGNAALDRFGETVKTNLDAMAGQQKNAESLVPLDPETATAADCARQLNAMLARMQGD